MKDKLKELIANGQEMYTKGKAANRVSEFREPESRSICEKGWAEPEVESNCSAQVSGHWKPGNGV